MKTLITTALLVLALFNYSFSQTKKIRIWSVGVKDSTIFAGTTYGVYTSNDKGSTWQSANNGIIPKDDQMTFIWNFFISEEKIYAVAGTDGIFVSSNGAKWEQIKRGLEEKEFVTNVWISEAYTFAGTFRNGLYMFFERESGGVLIPYNVGIKKKEAIRCFAGVGSTILAGTGSKTIYKSTDYGETWAKTKKGPKTKKTFDLLFHKKNVFAVCNLEKIYSSSDTGDSWTPIDFDLADEEEISALEGNESTMFMGTTKQGVMLSVDDGKTWTPSNDGLDNKSIMCLFVKDNSIYAGTNNGIYFSDDNGKKWRALGTVGLPK